MKKNVFILIIILLLILVSCLYLYKTNKGDENILQNNTQNSTTTIVDVGINNSDAVLVTQNGVMKYLNNKYNFSFNIPSGYHFSSQYLEGDKVKGGFIQMFNYDENGYVKQFQLNTNKIEGTVTNISKYSTSSDDIMQPENLKLSSLNINNKIVNVAEGNFGDTKFKTYYIPLKESRKYLSITIYGDINNFGVLDTLAKQIIGV